MLTWLHLSDFQIKEDGSLSTLDNLRTDLREQMAAEIFRPDFICISGDLSFDAQPQEFRAARAFYTELLEITGVPLSRLFVVPGNHDVNQSAFGQEIQDQAMQSSVVSSIPPWQEALSDYHEFLGIDLDTGKDSIEFGYYVRRFYQNRTNVAVIGLDSSWAGDVEPYASGDLLQTFRDRFQTQVQSALNQTSGAEIVIALLHHPLHMLSTANTINEDPALRLLLQNCHFILHSHVLSNARPGVSNQQTAIINGGSLPGIDEHPNTYNWVFADLNNGTYRVTMRLFSRKGNIWTPSRRAPNGTSYRLWDQSMPGFSADTMVKEDQLDITPDVNAFSSVFAASNVSPPLCLGLFGEWGSGKTFFMEQMYDRIELLADRAKAAQPGAEGGAAESEPLYHANIVQIRFNAWHYIDTNLWASLVNHIFKQLAIYLSPDEDSSEAEQKLDEAQKQQLFKELETAKALHQEAEAGKRAAQDRVDNAKQQLGKVIELRQQRNLNTLDIVGIAWSQLQKDQELMEKLDESVKAINPDLAIENAEQLDASLQELNSFRKQFQATSNKPATLIIWIIAGLIILVGIPLFTYMINQVYSLDQFQALLSSASAMLAQIAAILIALNMQLRPVLKATRGINEVRGKMVERINALRNSPSESEQELILAVTNLQQQEQAAANALAEAQNNLAEAQAAVKAIEDMKDERRLIRFIQERVASGDYERQLGIIYLIHNDFKELSTRLGKGDDPNLPKIDRIVLYIDDLDRCPENVVLDVLQAVHLILAFDLFVVVVGVDSRWLLRSLERSYPALRERNNDLQSALSHQERWAWTSTPQDYLEKIFQIPFNLRPMSGAGTTRLVDSILGRREPTPEEIEKRERALEVVDPLIDGELVIRPPSAQVSNGDGPGDGADDSGAVDIDLTPPSLLIEKKEQEFISLLTPFLTTPRDVKRFINIYRLLRARVAPIDLPKFVGQENAEAEYPAVMTLLAIQTGYPELASQVFRRIQDSADNATRVDLLSDLLPVEITGTDPLQFSNKINPVMDAAAAVRWRNLHQDLDGNDLKNASPSFLEIYIRWVPRVARFSFQAGKVINDTDGVSP